MTAGLALCPPAELVDEAIESKLACLADGKSILRVMKDPTEFLELASTRKGLIVSEQFGAKRYHLANSISREQAASLIRRYRKESVADANDWYPTLIEWKRVRFKHPLFFALLNERYRITSPVAMSVLLLIGVMIFSACFWIGVALRAETKLVFLPLALYGLLLSKRVDFVHHASGAYGYQR